MSYTKSEIVIAALGELGLSSSEFDITPEEIVAGAKRLDSMMAHWSGKGITLSYSSSAGVDEDSQIPSVADEAVITNLALRLAPSYGKQVAQEVRAVAKGALNDLMSVSTRAREVQFPSMPKGAGYKAINEPFTPAPQEEYLVGVDNTVDLSGGPDES